MGIWRRRAAHDGAKARKLRRAFLLRNDVGDEGLDDRDGAAKGPCDDPCANEQGDVLDEALEGLKRAEEGADPPLDEDAVFLDRA